MNDEVDLDDLPTPVRIGFILVRWIILFISGILFFVLVAKVMFSMDIEPSSQCLGLLFLVGGIVWMALINKLLITPATNFLARFFVRKPTPESDYFR